MVLSAALLPTEKLSITRLETSDPTRKVPQMRPQHHVQPLTNPPGHAQEPHERYRCKTTTKPTAATQPKLHQKVHRNQVKLLDWEPAQDVYLIWAFFHFSDEAVRGDAARSNLEALLRDLNNHIDSSPREPRFVLVPRAGLGKPWSASNANKPASSWLLKQGPKKWSKHGCDKGTLTVTLG